MSLPFLHIRRGVLPLFWRILVQEAQSWVSETLTTIAIPLSFFLAFGLGLRDYILEVDGFTYIEFITPGLITLTILLEAYRTGAWGLWLNRWHQKMIDEYRIKPVTTYDIIIGEILGGFTLALIKGAIVAFILFLLEPISITLESLTFYIVYMFAGSILFNCVGTIVGTLVRKPDQIAKSQTVVITPLFYLGGLFFPIAAFPEAMLPIVKWLPTTALFDGGRNALLLGQFDWFYVLNLYGFAIISFIIATKLFNHQLSK